MVKIVEMADTVTLEKQLEEGVSPVIRLDIRRWDHQ